MSDFDIDPAAWPEIEPFLAAILRIELGQPPDGATLLAARQDDVIVGAAAIHPEQRPGGATGEWRVGAIAVEHGFRGRGIGGAVLERCLEAAAAEKASHAWCRVPAGSFGFFARYGFKRTGDPAIGSAGPEYLMTAEIRPARRSWALSG